MNNTQMQRLQEKRRRAVLSHRFAHGFTGLLRNPWKMIPLLLIASAVFYLVNIRGNFIPDGLPSILATVYSYTSLAVILVLGLLLMIGVFYALSVPLCSRQYENALLSMNFTSYDGAAPALISRKRIPHSRVYVLTFYSMGIGKEIWERRQGEVEDVLNIQCVQPIQYGGRKCNNRNLIVLTAAPGTGNRRTEPLYDEF